MKYFLSKKIISGTALLLLIFPLFPGSAMTQGIFSDNFETGNYSKWTPWLQNSNCNTDSTMSVTSTAAHLGSYGLDIHYVLDDDPRGDCQLHQDNNTCIIFNSTIPLKHYFFRGYFKIALNGGDLCASPTVQRKLVYFKPQNYDSGGWAFFMVAWPWGSNCQSNGYCISLAYIGNGAMGATLWGDGSEGFNTQYNHIMPDTWYYIEAEVEYQTYGHDIMRIWLAPSGGSPNKIFERTDLTLRSSTDAQADIGLGKIEVGRQVDVSRSSYSEGWIDEHRYWDDIVISADYVGPNDITGPPSSPQNLR